MDLWAVVKVLAMGHGPGQKNLGRSGIRRSMEEACG